MLWTLNISIANGCRLGWWMVGELVDEKVDELYFSKNWWNYDLKSLQNSCHANYWFDYLRFCCDSSVLVNSNNTVTLKWHFLNVYLTFYWVGYYTISHFLINRRFYTYLGYVYKDSWIIYVRRRTTRNFLEQSSFFGIRALR